MYYTSLALLGAIIFIPLCLQIQGLRHNIREAKASGFEYLVFPFFVLSTPWILLQPFLVPLLDLLPRTWTQRWLP